MEPETVTIRPRLNAWLRLAIVASVIWMIVVSIWLYDLDGNRSNAIYQAGLEFCSLIQKDGNDYADCVGPQYVAHLKAQHEALLFSPMVAAIGLATVWILGWLITLATRWVLAGRTKPDGTR